MMSTAPARERDLRLGALLRESGGAKRRRDRGVEHRAQSALAASIARMSRSAIPSRDASRALANNDIFYSIFAARRGDPWY